MSLYKNCRDLPIHNFIELTRTNDLSLLIKEIEDEPEDPLVLQEKYAEIIDEYNSYFTNKSRNPQILNQSKFILLSLQLINLKVLNELISTRGITAEIENLCKSINVDPLQIETYLVTTNNELTKLQRQLEEKEEDPSEKDENSLEKTLTLVKENGFNFDRYKTPVIEFVFAINRLEEKSRQYKKL
ncbi:hypothetical protein CHRYSEOSP005_14940 [Chryseobacterium sp. Alg-005]|uniref:hypothetical protein n=1 Tax=Chryseobacterium sp. Alg-005 TaxID=3159516 RepID=UPI003555A605